MHLQITSPSGQVLDVVPVNKSIKPEDACYGLIEAVGDDAASVLVTQITDTLRDMCEPISIHDFDAKVGMECEHQGYKGKIVE